MAACQTSRAGSRGRSARSRRTDRRGDDLRHLGANSVSRRAGDQTPGPLHRLRPAMARSSAWRHDLSCRLDPADRRGPCRVHRQALLRCPQVSSRPVSRQRRLRLRDSLPSHQPKHAAKQRQQAACAMTSMLMASCLLKPCVNRHCRPMGLHAVFDRHENNSQHLSDKEKQVLPQTIIANWSQ